MPWKETNVNDQRKEFVLESLKQFTNFTDLCTKYGISTKTGYKWKQRFLEEGFAGLMDQSKRPASSPTQIAEDVILEIVKIKTERKKWGPRKIHAIYKRNHPNEKILCLTSVERILRKAGLIEPRKRNRRNTGIQIVNPVTAEKSNQVWTVDFKGYWYTPDKEKVNPLTVRDEFSKYILSIKALEKGNIPTVKAEFVRLFRQFGLPEVIRSDNGPPFASAMSLLGLTKLSVWWMSLGIKLDRIDPGCPYQNGGHERMHLDMMKELENQIYGDVDLHQKEFDVWRREFNRERPHEALNMETPESVYCKSDRKFYEYEELEYPDNFRRRKVSNRGYIIIKGQAYFFGNPFTSYYVGLKPKKTGELNVWFGHALIGSLDEKTKLLIPEKKVINKGRKIRHVLPMS
jgi:transposase InsO family protein